VLRDLLSGGWDEVPDVAREWAAAYPGNREEAELRYATSLADDYETYYGELGDPLLAAFMAEGLARVNWRQVARRLLAKYAPPPRPAVPLHMLSPSRN
jgi:hypothetical protein